MAAKNRVRRNSPAKPFGIEKNRRDRFYEYSKQTRERRYSEESELRILYGKRQPYSP